MTESLMPIATPFANPFFIKFIAFGFPVNTYYHHHGKAYHKRPTDILIKHCIVVISVWI